MFRQVDPREQQALASQLSISVLTASLLLGRGVSSPEQADAWLTTGRAPRHDPFLIPDLEKAIDRLARAVRDAEPICFYGDYDVDGIAATSLYLLWFRAAGAKVSWYIPDRLREGYGLNAGAIRHLAQQGVRVIVTSDCGTTAHRELTLAQALGIDVIVTDHHQGGGDLPPAVAVMNPHRGDSQYPFPGLCSAGLAFKVAQGYREKYGDPGCPLEDLLDLVALATIADVVPLLDENRCSVREGLDLLSRGRRCGIRALKRTAGVDGACDAGTVAFRLAPRINAAGRLAHADLGVRLLTTDSEAEAEALAAQLEALNRERQQVEEAIMQEASAAVGDGGARPAIVVASRAWHLGVVGIVAARLVERFHRPAVALSINEAGLAKGSARSIPGFDLYQALSVCGDLLEGYGGHPSAAGLTIQETKIPEFTSRFEALAGHALPALGLDPLLHIDAEVTLMSMGLQVVRELELLHPFGAGNPEPVLAVRRLTILDARTVGEGHLKLVVRQGRSFPFEGIGFRMGSLADRRLSVQQPIDLAFMPEISRWNGLDRLQLKIRDIRPSLPS
ncbi:single-stranded-DNA-specific exonuclease RecJ [Candidatus Nitrospira bockiana]